MEKKTSLGTGIGLKFLFRIFVFAVPLALITIISSCAADGDVAFVDFDKSKDTNTTDPSDPGDPGGPVVDPPVNPPVDPPEEPLIKYGEISLFLDSVSEEKSSLSFSGLQSVRAIKLIEMDGKTFAYVGSFTGEIYVYLVEDDKYNFLHHYSPAPKSADEKEISVDFTKIFSLTTAKLNNKTYLFAGMHDLGLAAYEVSSNGEISFVAHLEDKDDKTIHLESVQRFSIIEEDGKLYLFVGGDAGMSVVSFDSSKFVIVDNVNDNTDTPPEGVETSSYYLRGITTTLAKRVNSEIMVVAVSYFEKGFSAFKFDPTTEKLQNILNMHSSFDMSKPGSGELYLVTSYGSLLPDEDTFRWYSFGKSPGGSFGTTGIEILADGTYKSLYNLKKTAIINMDNLGDALLFSDSGNKYAVTGNSSGISYLKIDTDGVLSTAGRISKKSTNSIASPLSFSSIVKDGTTYIGTVSDADDGITLLKMSNSFLKIMDQQNALTSNISLENITAIGSANVGEKTYLIAVNSINDTLNLFEYSFAEKKLFLRDRIFGGFLYGFSGISGVDISDINGTPHIFVSASTSKSISALTIVDGKFNVVQNKVYELSSSVIELQDVEKIDFFEKHDGQKVLLASSPTKSAINAFYVGEDGKFGSEGSYTKSYDVTAMLENTGDIVGVSTDAKSYVYAVSQTANAIASFELNGTSFSKTEQIYISKTDDASLLLQNISSLTSAKSGEKNFVIATSFDENAVTVFEVAEKGALNKVNEVLDTTSTLFENPEGVNVMEVEGQTLVAVYGAEHGMTLFNLNKEGTLEHILDLAMSGFEDQSHPLSTSIIQNGDYMLVSIGGAGDPDLGIDGGIKIINLRTALN